MPTEIRPQPSAFDPFGERVDGPCAPAGVTDGGRARNLAVAVFWSLALLFVAGRAHLAAHAAPSAAIQASADAPAR